MRHHVLTATAVAAVGVLLFTLVVPAPPGVAPPVVDAPSPDVAPRPNILLIVSDDQRYDTMEYMPRTQAALFDAGVVFPNAFITTPLCCPSRSSIFTGLYASHHAVRQNFDELNATTVAMVLKDAGYRTGLVGKYLNSWDGRPRPEFDHWVAFPGGGAEYIDPVLDRNGVRDTVPGYITDILRDDAVGFVRESAQHAEPFFLVFAPSAPHRPATPAARHVDLYPALPAHRPPAFNEEDMSDKPAWMRELPVLGSDRINEIDRIRRDMVRSLAALDDAVVELLAELDRQSVRNETLVVYLSDNGFMWGEHRLNGKGTAYDVSARVPFAVAYPPWVTPGRIDTRVVANIDLAPTFYEVAGADPPYRLDGHSLVPLLRDVPTAPWREGVLIEAWILDHGYKAFHTGDHVYIETDGDRPELYDLAQDPWQVENVVDVASYAGVRDRLKAGLDLARAGL